jgi:hypothetical protein
MLTDETGSFLTQRKTPKMALIQPSVADNVFLVCSAPGMVDLKVPIDPPKDNIRQCRQVIVRLMLFCT